MTAIIAYGTVVRPPLVIGLPLPHEERSVAFSIVVDEDFTDDKGHSNQRALYRVILSGDRACYAETNLKLGSPVLVRGELFQGYPPLENSLWNHRVVFGEELLVLAGELAQSRAYPIGECVLGANVRIAV